MDNLKAANAADFAALDQAIKLDNTAKDWLNGLSEGEFAELLPLLLRFTEIHDAKDKDNLFCVLEINNGQIKPLFELYDACKEDWENDATCTFIGNLEISGIDLSQSIEDIASGLGDMAEELETVHEKFRDYLFRNDPDQIDELLEETNPLPDGHILANYSIGRILREIDEIAWRQVCLNEQEYAMSEAAITQNYITIRG